jgi:hypothetical protein
MLLAIKLQQWLQLIRVMQYKSLTKIKQSACENGAGCQPESEEHQEDIKSGVSASTKSTVVCTLPAQVSNRPLKDFTCSMPKTLG